MSTKLHQSTIEAIAPEIVKMFPNHGQRNFIQLTANSITNHTITRLLKRSAYIIIELIFKILIPIY